MYDDGSTRTGSSFVSGYDGTLSKLRRGIRSRSILLNEFEMVSNVSNGLNKTSSTESKLGSK